MDKLFYYNTDIGKIGIREDGTHITNIYFGEHNLDVEKKETDLIRKAYIQLEEYISGNRTEFNLPLKPKGTMFQNKVWDELIKIPYGQTKSYKEIAILIGNEKASRAVGMANNKNPIPIIIPCHRVIGSNKKLVGYAGGLDLKQKLLKIEGSI